MGKKDRTFHDSVLENGITRQNIFRCHTNIISGKLYYDVKLQKGISEFSRYMKWLYGSLEKKSTRIVRNTISTFMLLRGNYEYQNTILFGCGALCPI